MDISPTQLQPPNAKRSIYASPLTLSPPFNSYSSHQADVRPPSVFDSLVSTTPYVPCPVPTHHEAVMPSQQYCGTGSSGVRKTRVNLGNNLLSLNSSLTPDTSAFLPFNEHAINHTHHLANNHTHHIASNHTHNPTHNPSPGDKEAGKSYEGLNSTFHPVTTIS